MARHNTDSVVHSAIGSTTSSATFRADVFRALRADEDAEPSSVTLWIPELSPFGVRSDFRLVEDEDGHQHELKVGHAWVEPPGPERHPVSTRDEKLAENLYAYEQIARSYLEAKFARVMKIRNRCSTRRDSDSTSY
jgi:hypothetical protein